ncbi:hypothetical protein Cgig2_022584 [Carnegiea gigantea]|uniref:Peptidase A2 domain-containing protein n=1 Tax=Carnegiea gigantea TaxID=171969 RepID=A0A9Q1QKI0_9CARY|nr:hypothetical protein Cgig2_022584 [Carnegiea gigantea]
MVFGGKEAPRFAFPHNDPFVVEMKIASAIVRRILMDTGSSVDIIIWDCLKKLTHPGRDIIPLVHPILGFGGQEVNPTCMICHLVCFGDKLKAKNLEVDFLVVDVPMAYNVILRRATLHKTKKKEQGNRRGLHIRLSAILTALIFKSPGISIQGVSYLIPCTVTLTRRRNKLLVLGVSALVLGPLALVDVVEIPEGIGTTLLIALLPGLSRPFSPVVASALAFESASSSWRCKSFFLASWASHSAFSFSQRRWYQVASPSSLQHSAAALTPRVNAYAIVTSSSVILEGSETPEVAKSQDLSKS